MTAPRIVLVSGADARGALALAAAIAAEAAAAGHGAPLLAELGAEARRRQATMFSSPLARALEERLRGRGHPASARGGLCHLGAESQPDTLVALAATAEACGAATVFAAVPGSLWSAALEEGSPRIAGGVLLARLPGERPLAALAAAELRARRAAARVESRPPTPLAARRALAGVRAGGETGSRAARIFRAVLGSARAASSHAEAGQALPAVLGAGAILIGAALLLAAIGGAVTGKGRVQRAADLSAVSAVRSMRDDIPRLLAPARLENGTPNPRHIGTAEYLNRARVAAASVAVRNGVAADRIEVSFPDAAETPPLQARIEIAAEIDPAALPGGERIAENGRAGPIPVEAYAVAEASPPGGSWTGMEGEASGGGYSGPLVYRNGEGMRPDVAAAYDRMAAAARGAGHSLLVNSGFRSDAEQRALWEQHPDPRWVAPPGRSLHRCATELDLGPPSAYGWLASNARRFGFLQRYSWEPWHYGFTAGPPPCSEAGESGGLVGASPGGDGRDSAASVPAFVPERFRAPLLRSASRWNVSPALLAAQLQAESGFNPNAVSPAGAQGIAQFMPGTAASYGLRNPFDPVAAIDAQAHLMSDLLRQFRSIPLALAAYNAGPGAVGGCRCIPPYPETRAYVARILALLNGAGAVLAPPLEVRLVE